MKKLLYIILFLFVLFSSTVSAQEYLQEEQGIVRAKVVEIVQDETLLIPGTDTETNYQLLNAQILEGEKEGEVVAVENDFLKLKLGEKFFAKYVTVDEETIYFAQEPDRRGAIYFFAVLFFIVILVFGGWQGVRSLISLAGSFLIILFFLLPDLLAGAPPVTASVFYSVLILIFAIYVTHGFNKKSTSAVLGTVVTIILTGVLAYFSVEIARLSGFASDESIYLNFATSGQLDFRGLLLGAIIIGVLGILDDIAITQASFVEELKKTAGHLTKKEVYKKALKVGRDHVGALVNTLALAYAGAALPLLLLFHLSETSTSLILNQEIFATEIIRTIVGSIGLVMAVPLTTLIAVFIFDKKKSK